MVRLKKLLRAAAFNQAVAIPVALLVGVSTGFWLPSLIIATIFSQCVGMLCWITAPLVAPAFNRLPPARGRIAWLVENAIKHGIAPEINGGKVRISGARVDGDAVFVVSDTGSGTVAESGAGVGLDNVRKRLETIYGPAASVTLSRQDRATTTRVTLPLSAS